MTTMKKRDKNERLKLLRKLFYRRIKALRQINDFFLRDSVLITDTIPHDIAQKIWQNKERG